MKEREGKAPATGDGESRGGGRRLEDLVREDAGVLALAGRGDRGVASRRSGAWPAMAIERRGKGCARLCAGDAVREGSMVVGCCHGERVGQGLHGVCSRLHGGEIEKEERVQAVMGGWSRPGCMEEA